MLASAMLAGNLFITPQFQPIQERFNATSTPVVIEVSACDIDDKSKECVLELIKKYAKEYDFPENTALRVASCESEFKVNAVGDGGKAYGIYQFHKPTFDMFAKKFGEKLDYYDTEHNIQLAIWALSNDKGHHWTCYRKIASK